MTPHSETIQYRGRTWTIKGRDGNRLLIEWHGAKHPSKSGGWYCDYAIRWITLEDDGNPGKPMAVRYVGGSGFFNVSK